MVPLPAHQSIACIVNGQSDFFVPAFIAALHIIAALRLLCRECRGSAPLCREHAFSIFAAILYDSGVYLSRQTMKPIIRGK
jgi:hypothetical protein